MAVAVTTKFVSPVSPAEFGVHVNDPIEHLQHCHHRIERSLTIVKDAVAALRLTDPVLRTEGAAALDYELALLQLLTDLHIQDEEQSLFSRLRKNLSANGAESLKDLIPQLELQHREKQAIFRELAVCLRALTTEGEEGLERLENLVGHLDTLFRSHMTLEDERLMPNCRGQLAQVDLDEMRMEMIHRFQRR